MERYDISSDRRVEPRVKTTLPIRLKLEESSAGIRSDLLGEVINLSESGLCLASADQLPIHASVFLHIDSLPDLPIKIEAHVVWADDILKKNRFHCGVRFSKLNIENLRKLLGKINGQCIKTFLGCPIPKGLTENYKNSYILEKFNQQEIMKTINFTPPFLKIEKMAILGFNRRDLLQVRSLGMGLITTKETEGHYNDTIFLALCGKLMASSASVHLAILFPSTSPQVVEANGIKPLPLLEEAKGLWKPDSAGTTFFVESTITKKKLQLVVMRTTITFDNVLYGVIEELKVILTSKDSIWSARSFPPSATLRD